MDRAKVDQAVLAALPVAPEGKGEASAGKGWERGDYHRRFNDYTAETVSGNHRRFLGLGTVHPRMLGAADEVARIARDLKLCGLYVNHVIQGLPGRDESVAALCKQAGRLGLYVAVHGVPALGAGAPDDVMWLALQCPETRFVLLQMGGHRFPDILLPARVQKRYAAAGVLSNLYYDLGPTPAFFRGGPYWEHLVWIIREVGPDRFVYSSCFPDGEMGACLRALDTLSLTDSERGRILAGNMLDLVSSKWKGGPQGRLAAQ